MNRMDIKYFRLNADEICRQIADHEISGPLLIHRRGEPEAVIIKAKAYAPKLHHFQPNEDGWLTCHACQEPTVISSRPLNLAEALDTANQHWADNHREQK